MRLRDVAAVDPRSHGFGRGDIGTRMSFLPLDTVWQDDRFDPSGKLEFDGHIRSYTAVLEGDVLLPKVAPTFAHARVGLARGLESGRALATSEVFVVRAHDPTAASFLRYRLQAQDFITEGVASWTGVAGLKRISSDFVRDVRIAPQAWHDRKSISDYLDAETAQIDAMIVARTRQSNLLARRAQAVRDLMLANCGKPVRLSHMLNGIEQGWSPECEARLPAEDEWGVLKAGATNFDEFRDSESKALRPDLQPRSQFEVRAGDVLMSRANTRELAGSAAFVEICRPRLMMSDKLYRLVPDQHRIGARYLALVLQSSLVRARIEAETVGSSASMQNISQELVRDLRLPVPRLDEQDRIVAMCSDGSMRVRGATAAIERQISLLRERRQAIISAAVTEKLEVPHLSAASTAA